MRFTFWNRQLCWFLQNKRNWRIMVKFSLKNSFRRGLRLKSYKITLVIEKLRLLIQTLNHTCFLLKVLLLNRPFLLRTRHWYSISLFNTSNRSEMLLKWLTISWHYCGRETRLFFSREWLIDMFFWFNPFEYSCFLFHSFFRTIILWKIFSRQIILTFRTRMKSFFSRTYNDFSLRNTFVLSKMMLSGKLFNFLHFRFFLHFQLLLDILSKV